LTGADTGSAQIGTASITNNSYLTFQNNQTLDNATITISGGGDYIELSTTNSTTTTLTFGPNLTVLQDNGYDDFISAADGNILNEGAIEAAATYNKAISLTDFGKPSRRTRMVSVTRAG
jgi:hypothetical protein